MGQSPGLLWLIISPSIEQIKDLELIPDVTNAFGICCRLQSKSDAKSQKKKNPFIVKKK